jgi:hypothetical protein
MILYDLMTSIILVRAIYWRILDGIDALEGITCEINSIMKKLLNYKLKISSGISTPHH